MADIIENLQVLRDYSKQDRAKFTANKEAVRLAKYAFIVMIEASSNIANHLCARFIKTSSNSYAECFLLLGKHELISNKLSANLSKMAGFSTLQTLWAMPAPINHLSASSRLLALASGLTRP